MSTSRLLLPALAALAISACAHAPGDRAAAAPNHALASTHRAAVAPEPSAAPEPPRRVLVTGSHIPQRVDPRTGRAMTMSRVDVYTREDLLTTGRSADVASALLTLDPSIR